MSVALPRGPMSLGPWTRFFFRCVRCQNTSPKQRHLAPLATGSIALNLYQNQSEPEPVAESHPHTNAHAHAHAHTPCTPLSSTDWAASRSAPFQPILNSRRTKVSKSVQVQLTCHMEHTTHVVLQHKGGSRESHVVFRADLACCELAARDEAMHG
jgi:hypothetical protein